jgi:hypothetical protein
MRSVHCAVAAALAVSGCAKGASSISPSYVSPVMYQSLDCQQISAEGMRLSMVASNLSGMQDQKAKNDAVAMGVGLVLFWPALFFIKGNDEKAGELAMVRGQMDALQQAAILKNCGIEFKVAEPTPPPALTKKTTNRDRN